MTINKKCFRERAEIDAFLASKKLALVNADISKATIRSTGRYEPWSVDILVRDLDRPLTHYQFYFRRHERERDVVFLCSWQVAVGQGRSENGSKQAIISEEWEPIVSAEMFAAAWLVFTNDPVVRDFLRKLASAEYADLESYDPKDEELCNQLAPLSIELSAVLERYGVRFNEPVTIRRNNT